MYSIVSDTTTIIILGKLNRYDLLENIFSKIYVPQEVMREISVKEDGIYEKIEQNLLFESKDISDTSLFDILNNLLDSGESQAIVLAKELNLILLIDEKKGRKIAKNMGLNIIGLLGILILNVKKKYTSKDEALKILERIKELNFRVSQKLENSFLEQISK